MNSPPWPNFYELCFPRSQVLYVVKSVSTGISDVWPWIGWFSASICYLLNISSSAILSVCSGNSLCCPWILDQFISISIARCEAFIWTSILEFLWIFLFNRSILRTSLDGLNLKIVSFVGFSLSLKSSALACVGEWLKVNNKGGEIIRKDTSEAAILSCYVWCVSWNFFDRQ